MKKKTVFFYFIIVIVLVISISIYFVIEQTDFQPFTKDNLKNTEKIITDFERGHEFKLQSISGIIKDDSGDFVYGNQALKVTTEGNGELVTIKKSDFSPPIDLTDKFLKLWIKISDTKKISKLKITVTGDDFETYKTYWIHKNNISPNAFYFRNNYWNPLTISLTQTKDFGLPDISKIDTIEFSVRDTGKGPVTVWFDGLSYLDNTSEGIVTFTFDDSFANQYTNARPILAKYDYPATAYINTGSVGSPKKLTLDQLRELQDIYGWDISSHLVRHMDITQKRYQAEVEDELALSKQYLLDNGLTKGADHFAYPFGKFDNDYSMNLVQKYYKTARVIRGDVETFPVSDPYKLRVMYLFNYTNPDKVSQRVEDVMENGDWLILVFHGIVDSNADHFHSKYLKSNFEKIVDDIYNKGIKVMTISEVFNNKFP